MREPDVVGRDLARNLAKLDKEELTEHALDLLANELMNTQAGRNTLANARTEMETDLFLETLLTAQADKEILQAAHRLRTVYVSEAYREAVREMKVQQ